MYRSQWKTWATHNSVVLNWAVKISTTQRSIRWCELRQNKTTGVWSMYQQGTYTPDANTRWMGSIAMDNNGSIGLSYIKSNSTSIYPGLFYTGRRTCDPLGTLPVTETLIAAGTGYQTGTNRVGDYAQTVIDPDGTTFWSTSEYMGGTSGSSAASTRIFSYQITPCSTNPVASLSIALTSGTNPSCAGDSKTFTATPTNGGTTPSYQWKVGTTNVGTNSPTFTTNALTNGQTVSCVMTSNLVGVTGNPATSNSISVTVNSSLAPSVSIALTSGTNPSCAGASKTFTATPTNGGTVPSYQWKVDTTNVGTNSPTFTTSALTAGQVVTCIMTSNLSCASPVTATSNDITISYSTPVTPSVSIAITTGSNPSTSGASVTFTATSTNGGTTPTYQWKVSGVNVGTNSNTYTTNTLTNGQVVTCVMTSSAACPSPASVTSNSITMTINSATYCNASTTSTNFEYINNVVMGSINNTTGASSYTNYSSLSTNIVQGTATPLTITIGKPYSTDKVVVFCDWNNNSVFTDAGETVYTSPAGAGPFTTNITAPASSNIGAVRMRIRLTDGASGANLTSCGASTYGEVEDYSLVIGNRSQTIINDTTSTYEPAPVALKSEPLTVFPNPNSGTFTVQAEHEGIYYLMDGQGKLLESFNLNKDNRYTKELTVNNSGVYIAVGQNKFGVLKQKIIVNK